MVYFRDQHWLTVHSATRFEVLINTKARERRDVFWMLNLRHVAGGAEWRRVKQGHRPSLSVRLTGFKPQLRDWTDLEQLNFWDLEENEDALGFGDPSGHIQVDYQPKAGSEECERSCVSEAIWRVAGREGGRFTVELAGFADGRRVRDQLAALDCPEQPDGTEGMPEPWSGFWQEHAELYLREEVPFGTVTVRVPRNVRDPEAYALRRASELVGVGEPEHIEVSDLLTANQRRQRVCPPGISEDVFVELHFNGYFED